MNRRRRPFRRRWGMFALAATAIATSASNVHATIWDADDAFGSTGFWSTDSNWDTNVEPSGNDNVFFPTPPPKGITSITLSLEGAPIPFFGEFARAVVFQDSYQLSGASLTMSASGTGGITTVAGTSSTISSQIFGTGTIGLTKGGPGTLTLKGGGSYIGETHVSFGTLRVEGGTFGSNGGNRTKISQSPALPATAIVTGATTVWNSQTSVEVGLTGGNGTLNVEAGGTVTSATGKIGTATGSIGVATVAGNGSSWAMTGAFEIGDAATGTLNVDAGANVSAQSILLGSLSLSGNGTATVSGAGSTLTSATHLLVGEMGTGTLTIQDGGSVSAVNAGLGWEAGSTGTATVTGAGSTWTSTGGMTVGNSGGGTLNILAGGAVSSAVGEVGWSATGAVTVSGAGSTWNNTSELSVGVLTNGTLTIASGGSVSSPSAFIARIANAQGTVTLSGAGSNWTINNDLSIGSPESGSAGVLNINGGTVTVGGNLLDNGAGVSTINLDGGALDMTGGTIGSGAPVDFLNFRSGTLKNVAQINNGAGLTKTGTGNLILDGSNTYTGPTTVSGGTLVFKTSHITGSAIDIADGASAQLAANAVTPASVVVRTGSIDTHASGKLDLRDNRLIVTTTPIGSWNGSAYTGVTGRIDTGRGSIPNAQWDGPGIMTSDSRAVNNGDLCSIGVASAAQVKSIAATATATWSGQTVTGTDTLVMFTWGGDANLDGTINIDDYGRIDSNVAQSGSVFGWFNGDFNYDGKINIDDYGIIDANISQQGAPFGVSSPRNEAVAAVPEPSAVAGLTWVAGGILLRRARRR